MTSRLSSMLVQDGRVTAKKMADAFQRQVIFGGTLDTILLEMGLVEADLLGEYLARATGLPYSSELPAPDAANVVHQGFTTALVEKHRALPLGMVKGQLRVMVLDAPDREDTTETARELARELDRPVELVVGPEYRFQQSLEMLYGVRLLPRFAKIAGRIESGVTRVAPGSPASGPSLFAGRRPQTRPTIDTVPAPAPRIPGSAVKPGMGVTFSAPATGAQRGAETMARVSPDPVRTDGSGPVDTHRVVGTRSLTPVAVVAVRRGVIPSGGDTAPAGGVPGGKVPTPAQGIERRVTPVQSTLRGMAPLAHGSQGEAGAAGHLSAFEVMNGPATLEDFVLPESNAVATATHPGHDEGAPPEPAVDPVVPSLPLAEGLQLLHSATDRDAVLEVLCRVARGRFAFAAIYVVNRAAATLSMALGAAFFDRTSLRATEVPLTTASPLRTAVQTLSPYIGLLGDEDVLGETLAYLGRRVPIAGALLPIVIRGRCVAVLHVDDGGRVVSADELAELIHAASETASAFLRIIQAQKQGAPSASAPPSSSGPSRSGRKPIATPAGVPLRGAVASSASGPVPQRMATAASGRRISDLPQQLDGTEVQQLLQVVEADDPVAAPAAVASLMGAPLAAAAAVAERFPGTLRFAYRKPHAIGLPLSEHGPLLALAGRLGATMVAPMVQRLTDTSADHRFYAALVLAELRSDEAVVPLGLRLYDADPAVRRATAFALSRHAPSPTLGRVLDQVRDELGSVDMDRQRAAAAAAGELRDVNSVPKLIDLLTHRDMEIVDLARRSLVILTKQDFGTARWRWRSWWEKARLQSRSEWLLAGLDQPSLEARRSAIDELGVISTDRLGCHARLSRREREEAQRRFVEWMARHPEALEDSQ